MRKDDLTPKQALFCLEYVIDNNGKRAAIAAGYSPHSAHITACKLLNMPKIQKAITKAREMQAKSIVGPQPDGTVVAGITRERVLAEFARIAFSDIRKVASWKSHVIGMVTQLNEETGEEEQHIKVSNEITLKDSDELDSDVAASVAEVSRAKDGTLKVKLYDKQGALLALAKHLGLMATTPAVRATQPAATKADEKPDDKAPQAPPVDPHDQDGNWLGLLN